MGAPPMYEDPKEMQKKIEQYFKDGFRTIKRRAFYKGELIEYEIPKITITDLVLYLGFANRASFYDYEKKKDFTHTIKRARTFIEREYEEQLDANPTGAIFALKNFGWSDKQETEIYGKDGGNINFGFDQVLNGKDKTSGAQAEPEKTN